MTTTYTPAQSFPDITLQTVTGETIALAKRPAEKFSILIFYRGLHCPKCKAQLREIDAIADNLIKDGFNLLAVSMDSHERAKLAVKDWELANLPVAYGLSEDEARKIGLFLSDSISEKEPNVFAEPGLFVLEPDGTIYAGYIQNTPFGRPPIQDIINGLNFVIDNGYPIRGTHA